MTKFFKILHLLSFEVVLGAVVCNVMFWKMNKIPPEHFSIIVTVLGFSVWIIYVLDRLLDNQKSDFTPTERHIFHRQNARNLWYFIGLLTVLCTILVFYLPFNILIFGIIISSLTGVYLFIISKVSSKNHFQYYKEPITAFVYVSAVFGTTILHDPQKYPLLIGFIFLLIVFQNLLLFSVSELKKDINSINLARYFGIKGSHLIIVSITFVTIILGVYLIYFRNYAQFAAFASPQPLSSMRGALSQIKALPFKGKSWDGVFQIVHSFDYFSNSNYENKVVFMEMIMSLILLVINQNDKVFLTNDRYRWVGDGIFLLPLLIIF